MALLTTQLTSATPSATGTTPQQVVNTLLGAGVTITNITYQGALVAAGLFQDNSTPNPQGFDIGSGIILSTGNIATANGPNNLDNAGTDLGQPGLPTLDALVAPKTTRDGVLLQIDFILDAPIAKFRYVFASEEYNEFVGSSFNDVFGFFLNGQNIALIPGTTSPVTINNVNNGSNSVFFRDNDTNRPNTPFETQFDGFTRILTAGGTVNPGVVNTIVLAIADTSDGIFDSAVFLQASSFSSTAPDLAVTKVDTPDPVSVGSRVTYTITVTNTGTEDATEILVRDTLPTGFTDIQTSVSGGGFVATVNGNVVDFGNGAVKIGETFTLTVSALVPENFLSGATEVQREVENLVEVDPLGLIFDLDRTNNAFVEKTTVVDPIVADIAVNKTDQRTTAAPGDLVTYLMLVQNLGPSIVRKSGADIEVPVVLTVFDDLPAGLTNATFTASGTGGATGFLTSGSAEILKTTGDPGVTLPLGASVTYVISGTVTAPVGTVLENQSRFVAQTPIADPNPLNNVGLDRTTIVGTGESPSAGVLVSIVASDLTAAEAGSDPGRVTFTRTGSTTDPLTVAFYRGGNRPPTAWITKALVGLWSFRRAAAPSICPSYPSTMRWRKARKRWC
ncbi:MAG: DUF11 domain-containing protein [Oscillatoriales cyanobacterium SM2_1_8]|nr:DUF11 domain-containing protein [Oscillatoriales cyanobacterium SM2_1_8]